MNIKLHIPFLTLIAAFFALPPNTLQAQLVEQEWGQTIGQIRIHPQAENMEDLPLGPFAILPGGDLLTVEDGPIARHAIVSSDNGATWSKTAIFADPDKYGIRPERALMCTREGTVIVAFMNDPERAGWAWDPEIHDSPKAQLPTYTVRSTDGGQTWETPVKCHDDWTGAIRDMIQTEDGAIVFTSQMLLHNPGRHATITYRSEDQGQTWTGSNIVDLGGIGHHDGAIESTIVERDDDSLYMLLRTNWGRQWQAVSWDGGLQWNPIGPTSLSASTTPAILERLDSGRIFVAWNQFYYAGTDERC